MIGESKERIYIGMLFLPALAIIAFSFIYPFVHSVYLSFFDYNLAKMSRPFVGWRNYLDILSRPEFLYSFTITLYFAVVSVGLQLVIGMGIALFLSQQFKGQKTLRAVIILPWAISNVVNGVIWRWMFHYQLGVINYILKNLGIINVYKNWLGSASLALHCIIIADIWKWTPIVVIILLAGLESIPPQYYEVSKVDGANALQRFYHITLPLIRYPILMALTLRTIDAIRTFALPYVLTGGGPAESTMLVSIYIYDEAFRYLHFGYASAISYIVAMIIFTIALVYLRTIPRKISY